MTFEREEKKDDDSIMMEEQHPKAVKKERLTLVKALIGDCLCQGSFPTFVENRGDQATQFINIHGIEFIGLGAVVDELNPKERVYDTLEQLTNRTERLISIGYLTVEDPKELSPTSSDSGVIVETVPLDVWNKTYPNDNSMSRRVKSIINNIKAHNFDAAISEYMDDLKAQRAHPNKGNNRLLAGITAHNLGVLNVLAGNDDEAIPLFEEAIDRKRNKFGKNHPEVAISLDEIGIQFFAKSMFVDSLKAFEEARNIREMGIRDSSHDAKVAMLLNNIACCHFQMRNHDDALRILQAARDTLSADTGVTATADLDLLHVAITHCNYAYLLLRAKKYEEARSIFEESLLIQQSVLGDNHRAIRDTLSNIEFTNAFHS